ncbi:MAG: diacylglycerol kinase [Alphaproteobacteria bacterium HGW-Alphaproteobacteria-6]|nr:MAG: diacylglycerol kinase [Alphaproteobacteria bacterium HGW-Alphaproteobacteria-6]
MLRPVLIGIAALAAAALAGVFALTRPAPLPADAMAGLVGDAGRGAVVFRAGGCAACHRAPEVAGRPPAPDTELGGGMRFASPFGTFIAPNISPDLTQGIGGWSVLDLANAMQRGVSPDGRHYYPVFPYASYIRAEPQDIADLHAYLLTLPPVATPSLPHEVGFPFSVRRGLGLWKWRYLDPAWVVAGDLSPEETRGRYLAEALGHCGECHSPRDRFGGIIRARWLSGAPVPGAKGSFPNITPARLDWSVADITEYLTSGFTPDYDSAGGHMALVIENTAHLPQADRAAIAAYLKRVPPVASPAAAP